MRPREEDIDSGIVIPEIYDGVSVWLLNDGTMLNRWEGVTGIGLPERPPDLDE